MKSDVVSVGATCGVALCSCPFPVLKKNFGGLQ